MSQTIRIRLRVPEGKPGDVITVADARAESLVNARYAEYTGKAQPEPVVDNGPDVELPATGDVKAEWERVAESLGISLTDDNGDTKNKDELVAEVRAAVGG